MFFVPFVVDTAASIQEAVVATHPIRQQDESAVVAAADDLRFYQLEVGLRLTAPVNILWRFMDFDEVKRVLFEDDLGTIRGFRIFVEGAIGASYNESVPVSISGVPAGNLYDDGIGPTSTIRVGLEYAGKWGSIYTAVTYQILGALPDGNSPLDGSGTAFQTFFVGGGVDLRF